MLFRPVRFAFRGALAVVAIALSFGAWAAFDLIGWTKRTQIALFASEVLLCVLLAFAAVLVERLVRELRQHYVAAASRSAEFELLSGRLTSIFEAVSAGLVLVGKQGEFIQWNSATEQILRVSRAQLEGRDALDPSWEQIRLDGAPLKSDELPAIITLRSGIPINNFTHGVKLPDGSRRWLSVSTAPLRDAAGEISAVVASFRDVTARVADDTQLNVVIEAAGLGTWDWNVPTGAATYNARFAEMLGYERSEIEPDYRVLHRLLHPEDKARAYAAATEHLEGKSQQYRIEFRMRRKDGSWAWVLCVGKVTERDSEGQPIRASGVHIDITQAKETEARADVAQRELQRTRASLEEAQEVAHIGSWNYEHASGLIEWSKETYWLFGRAERDGTPTYEEMFTRFVDEDAARLRDAVTEMKRTGNSYAIIVQKREVTNGVRYVRARGRLRHDANGKIIGTFGTVADVTAMVEREEALVRAQDDAVAASETLRETNQVLQNATSWAHSIAIEAAIASKAKSEFLANMSHEIRTPLTAILGFAELLRAELSSESPERTVTAVETINRAGNHLLTVINDVLDLSKIDAGKLQLELVETNIPLLLSDVDALMRARAEGKGVVLRTSLETPMPNRVLSDPTRIRQILMNLVGNAIKFTDDGEIHVRASVVNDGERALMRLEVRDSGCGMTFEEVGRLFQPFTQADASVTRKFGGTGLGLAICLRLARLMEGTVRLDHSAPGVGSVFVVELPLNVIDGSSMVRVITPSSQAHNRRSASGPCGPILSGRILLAEDGEDNQRLIAFILEKAGAEVTIAANGVEAFRELSAATGGRPFSLIVTDMQMPEMDGYTLARTLRAQANRIPIVALTAHAMAEDRAKCLAAGCDDYATKPIQQRVLLETCAKWMNQSVSDEIFSPISPASHSIQQVVSQSIAPAAFSVEGTDVLLSELLGDGDMEELVTVFLTHLSTRIASVESAYAVQDLSGLASVAHQLKGAAGSYGYPGISKRAHDVERAARDPEARHQLGAAVNELRAVCQAALRAVPQSTST